MEERLENKIDRRKLWWAGVLSGPIAGFLLMATLAFVTTPFVGFSGFGRHLTLALAGLLYGAVIGWPYMLLFGVFGHRRLYDRGLSGVGRYLVYGVIGSALATAIIFVPASLGGAFSWTSDDLVLAVTGMFIAVCFFGLALATWVFWLIRRPDKDAAEYKT
jgi:hypothetical protein